MMDSELSSSPTYCFKEEKGDLGRTLDTLSSGKYDIAAFPGYSSVPIAPGSFGPFQGGQNENLSYMLALNCSNLERLA